MLDPVQVNKIESIDADISVKEYLNNSLCRDAGIIPLVVDGKNVKLGAMNPMFSEVHKISQKLKSFYGVNVLVEQISTEEWEKWFDSNDNLSNKNKLTNSLSENLEIDNTNSSLNKVHEDEEKINKIEEEKEDEDEDEDEDDVKLTNFSEFDFIDFGETEEEEEEEEEETDVFDDSSLSASSDPVVQAVGAILYSSKNLGASDIHAEPLENKMRIRYRIDGVLKETYSLPKKKARAIVSRIKVMSKLDIAEKRLPQDGRIRCKLNDQILDFRVSTLPGKYGEKIVLRSLSSDSSMLKLDKLISSPKELNSVRDMGASPYGILIVVGPTGSGKSTTLYSILNERNTPEVNISTVEDPVEYTLPGIHQVQVLREKGLDFSRALRSLMRQDPDIILVGETRDKETAQTAMEAALTGHMVFTTLHANDTATAITRLNEMGIPPYLVGSSVIGVMAQRLVRKVCSSCAKTKKVIADDTLASSYNIEKIKVANINDSHNDPTKVCPVCNGTGYKGRIGLYEVLKINDSIRELIMKSSTADVIRDASVKNGLKTLLDYGMELVKDQLTTIEEVERVCILEDSGDDL
jgi:type IV pilus assembly protein PilB